MQPIGRKSWVIPGGHIPLESTGREPTFTSNDLLCVLNAGGRMANLRMTLHYPMHDPVGPYPFTIAPERMRHIRFNDLIDPVSMPLEMDYAAVIESDVPVVVQFGRLNTARKALATFSTLGFADDA
ncbi:MAG TPA: sensory rhodopsin transducer [Longimicrobiaceae bacterium]|nr:sensory rhodopsin transducer [Longimicrobiaceae bacterium]